MFILHNTPADELSFPGVAVSPVDIDLRTAKFDLLISLGETTEGLTGWIEYATDVFEAPTIARLAAHWRRMLEQCVDDPLRRVSAVPLVGPSERRTLLDTWNRMKRAYDLSRGVHDRIADVAARVPDRVAVSAGGATLTYRDLDVRASQLAHCLRDRGVAPRSLVDVCLDRSIDLNLGRGG